MRWRAWHYYLIMLLLVSARCDAWDDGGYFAATNWQSLYRLLDVKCRATLTNVSATGMQYRVPPLRVMELVRIATGIVPLNTACATSIVAGVTNVWCWTNYVASYTNVWATNGLAMNGAQEVYVAPTPYALAQIDATISNLADVYFSAAGTSTVAALNGVFGQQQPDLILWSYMGDYDCEYCEHGNWPDNWRWIKYASSYAHDPPTSWTAMHAVAGIPIWSRPLSTYIETNAVPGYYVGNPNVHSVSESKIITNREYRYGFPRSTTVTPYRVTLGSIVFTEEVQEYQQVTFYTPSGGPPIYTTSDILRIIYVPRYFAVTSTLALSQLPDTWGPNGSATTKLYITPPIPLADGDWAEFYDPILSRSMELIADWSYNDEGHWMINVRKTNSVSITQAIEYYESYGVMPLNAWGTKSWVSSIYSIMITNWDAEPYEQKWSNGVQIVSNNNLAGLSIEFVTEGVRYEMTTDDDQIMWEPSKRDYDERMRALRALRAVPVYGQGQRANGTVFVRDMYLWSFNVDEFHNTNCWPTSSAGLDGAWSANPCALKLWTPSNELALGQSNLWYVEDRYLRRAGWSAVSEDVYRPPNPPQNTYHSDRGWWPQQATITLYSDVKGQAIFTWSREGGALWGWTNWYCAVKCHIHAEEPRSYYAILGDSGGNHEYTSTVRHVAQVNPGWNAITLPLGDGFDSPANISYLPLVSITEDQYEIIYQYSYALDRPYSHIAIYLEPDEP